MIKDDHLHDGLGVLHPGFAHTDPGSWERSWESAGLGFEVRSARHSTIPVVR